MQVYQGASTLTDATEAVAEAAAGMPATLEMLFVFSSTKQDPDTVAACLAERFPGVPLAGCTTAGEHLSGAHSIGGLVLAGLDESGLVWSSVNVPKVSEFGSAEAKALAEDLFQASGMDPEEMDPETAVCLLFVDGLQGVEERLSSELAAALQGVPLAGGSAGDDLKFEKTHVYGPQGAQSNAASVVMARSLNGTPIQILKHQHFTSTPESVVVTQAEGRRVHEFDGLPALEGYARALACAPEEVNGDVSFLNPLTFACNGELYVRSIQAINPDGSIDFYCAVEEGMVLDIGGHADMTQSLAEGLAWSQRPAFVVGFNCILRALEASGGSLHEEQGQVLTQACQNMIGFDTYGEQLNGLHINQTLVAVGFGRAAA